VDSANKRRSHGGDSKYGFSTSVRNSKSNSIDMYASPPAEAAEDLQVPPPPGKTGSANGHVPGTPNTSSSGSLSLPNSAGKRSQSQPPNRISPPRSNGSEAPPSLPNVPPKIDRQKKPSRRSGSSSNNTSGNNGTDYLQTNGSKANSLERHSHVRDLKMVMACLRETQILGRTTQPVGRHNLSDDTTCRTTKIEALQFLSSDAKFVFRVNTPTCFLLSETQP
jgi:hypothetical protein